MSITEGENINYELEWASEDNIPKEEIEELKRKNDWGMEVDMDKCIKTKILRKKENGLVRKQILRKLYNKALGDDAYARYKYHMEYLIEDDYGRSIYLGRGKYLSNRFVVMLFQPDGSYNESKCLIELSDTQKYQDELSAFKDLNDWNQPIQIE